MKSLQEITDAWGSWMLTQYSNGDAVNFTASTNYGDYTALDQYADMQVVASWGDVTFTPVSNPPNGEVSSGVVVTDNATDVPQSVTLAFSEKVRTTSGILTTETSNIGVDVNGIMEVFSLGVSYTINTESVKNSSISIEKTWAMTVPVVVPAQSSVSSQFVVVTQDLNMTWSVSVVMSGYVAIWFSAQVILAGHDSAHWLWFVPIEQVFSECIANSLIDLTGYAIKDSTVTTAAKGTLTASGGISARVDWTPLQAHSESEGQPKCSYSVPLSRGLRSVPGPAGPLAEDSLRRRGSR
jgi:hypothetical protein